MAGFSNFYNEILEMIKHTVLDVRMARAICRKAGVWPPAKGGGGFPAVTFTGEEAEEGHHWEIMPGGSGYGFYFWPDGVAKHCPRVNLSNSTEMRLCVHNRRPGPPHKYVYPVYTAEADWDEIPDTVGDPWKLMDGNSIPFLGDDQELWTLPDVEPRVSLFAQGSYFTDWVEIIEDARQDVFVGFTVTGVTSDEFGIGYITLQVR